MAVADRFVRPMVHGIWSSQAQKVGRDMFVGEFVLGGFGGGFIDELRHSFFEIVKGPLQIFNEDGKLDL